MKIHIFKMVGHENLNTIQNLGILRMVRVFQFDYTNITLDAQFSKWSFGRKVQMIHRISISDFRINDSEFYQVSI